MKGKLNGKSICKLIFILIFLLLIMYLVFDNINNNTDFLKTPLTSLLSMIIAIVISYYFVQSKNQSRISADKIEKFLIKIQVSVIEVNDCIQKENNASVTILISQRNINSRISSLLSFKPCKLISNDLIYIREKVNEYFDLYYDKKGIKNEVECRFELNSISQLIDKKIDEIQLSLSEL